MKKILIIEFWNCNPHLETALEISKRHLDEGDSVSFYFCGHDTLYKEGISVTPEECGLFRKLPEVLGVDLIKSKKMFFSDRVKFPNISFDVPSSFLSLQSLMDLKYKTFEVGQAVCSSLVSNLRNSEPCLENNYEIIRNMILSAIQVYEFTKKIVESNNPDLIYVFNGRFCNHRAAMRGALDLGKKVLIHERGANRYKFDVQPFMPHDTTKVQEKIMATWQEVSEAQEAYRLGESFFIERREGLEQSWESFTAHQKRNLLPDIDRTKKVITYFSSSDDEFVSVGDMFKFTTWKNQYQAVNDLIDICAKDKNIQLFIRIHPHLRDKSIEDQQRWRALGEIEGVTIVSYDSEIDTYALIECSDLVVTAGSTVGIEAVYWGRPSITLGPSYYSNLNVSHYPNSKVELKEMIQSNSLGFNKKLTIPFGYYMKTFGITFVHYEPETLFSGKFLGVDLRRVTSSRKKWLKCKQLVAKPLSYIRKLLNLRF